MDSKHERFCAIEQGWQSADPSQEFTPSVHGLSQKKIYLQSSPLWRKFWNILHQVSEAFKHVFPEDRQSGSVSVAATSAEYFPV